MSAELVVVLGLFVVLFALMHVPIPSKRQPAQPPSLPDGQKAKAPRGSTTNVPAHRLVKGVLVLLPSSPYRFRAEEIRWIEKQPLNGRIVAHLEGSDPETGAVTQRWHEWRPSDRVTVFVSTIDLDEHGGRYDELVGRYGGQQQAEEEKQWQRVTKLTFPE